jgi:DNA modification methylase
MKLDVIHNTSCEDLSALDDESVVLTVTSPPYWNAIDYDVHSKEGERAHYRTRAYAEGYEDYEEYVAWIDRIFLGVLEKTRPGAFCAIVIGTVLLDRRHYPVPMDFVARLTASGWQFHQDIIWHKCTAGVKRAGVFIQKPYPGYFYPNIMTEYILVFRKPGQALYDGKSSAEKSGAKVAVDEVFTKDVANNVWHIAPVPPGLLDHPCPFPEEIPHRLIQLYSYPGDLILDPFAGSGQVLKVARALGRPFVGYDTSERYVKYARARRDEPLSIRPEQLIAKFDKAVLGSPTGQVPRAPSRRTRHGSGRRERTATSQTAFQLKTD